ncbi:MAG TPA: hypothetical protein PLE54_06655 [Burkholderiaceae bacterium]|nr:hypothetical protein [Burkholderiaceae bacterium]HQR70265.1 hypothetical protein [Burkholderiaceae bacterium]
MASERCAQPIEFEQLVAYWLGELAPAAESAVEDHYLGCGYCAHRLEQLSTLADGIRAAVRSGAVRAVITRPFLESMKREGMRIREYPAEPGKQVACAIRIDDDAVASRLQAPLAGVRRVDLLESVDLGDGRTPPFRLEDVPFDPDAGEVISLPPAAALRRMPSHTVYVHLVAVDERGDRLLGEYTFVHSAG